MVFQNNDLVVTEIEGLPVMGHIVSLSTKPGTVSVLFRTPEGYLLEQDLYLLERVKLVSERLPATQAA
jgi:hypothetical protein